MPAFQILTHGKTSGYSMRWLIEVDRRLGSSHAEQSLPCQDNFCHLSKGNWHSICISDGAGSSRFSDVSSKFVSEYFSQSLLLLSDLIEVKGPGSWINDHIIREVLDLRKGLKEYTGSPELDDYHCTLVAILVSQSVAIAIHIGDGAIIAGKCEESSGSSCILNATLIASLPENGDYKNETFFITEPHWLKHLRIKVLGKVDWFVMGSDGGIEILSNRQKLDGPLVSDLINYISPSNDEESAVSQLMDSEFAAGKTTDDISLAIGWLGPAGVQRDLVWDEELSKALYLDPAIDVSNHQPNVYQGNQTAPVTPNDQLRSNFTSAIFSFPHRKSAVKFLMILVFAIFLAFCVYFLLRSEDVSGPIEENGPASSHQVEEEGYSDNHSSNGSDTIDQPAENGFTDSEELPLERPQRLPELQEDPSGSILERLRNMWSIIIQRDDTEQPSIHELAPRAVEKIEL